MLILARQEGEEIMIGDDICLKVVAISGNQVRLGFAAPPEVPIFRREIYDALVAQNQAAAATAHSPAKLNDLLKAKSNAF
jgi:carbon storage regulator